MYFRQTVCFSYLSAPFFFFIFSLLFIVHHLSLYIPTMLASIKTPFHLTLSFLLPRFFIFIFRFSHLLSFATCHAPFPTPSYNFAYILLYSSATTTLSLFPHLFFVFAFIFSICLWLSFLANLNLGYRVRQGCRHV